MCVCVCKLLCLLPPRAMEALAKALCGWVSHAGSRQAGSSPRLPAPPNNAALRGPRSSAWPRAGQPPLPRRYPGSPCQAFCKPGTWSPRCRGVCSGAPAVLAGLPPHARPRQRPHRAWDGEQGLIYISAAVPKGAEGLGGEMGAAFFAPLLQGGDGPGAAGLRAV